jgi:hypothetical protein
VAYALAFVVLVGLRSLGGVSSRGPKEILFVGF